MRARTLLAIILASLAGCVAYLALVYRETTNLPASASSGLVMLALPATLCAMVFVTFVLLPLWHWLERAKRRRRVWFFAAGWAAWLFLTVAVLALTQPSPKLTAATQLLVPGFVLVLVFGVIARWD